MKNIRLEKDFKVPFNTYIRRSTYFDIDEEAARRKCKKTELIQEMCDAYFENLKSHSPSQSQISIVGENVANGFQAGLQDFLDDSSQSAVGE